MLPSAFIVERGCGILTTLSCISVPYTVAVDFLVMDAHATYPASEVGGFPSTYKAQAVLIENARSALGQPSGSLASTG